MLIYIAVVIKYTLFVTGFTKIILNCTIGNSRIANLKH